MIRHSILVGLCLALAGCVAPAVTNADATPAIAYTPDSGVTVAPFPGPEAPVDESSAPAPTDPTVSPATTTAEDPATTTTRAATSAPRTTTKATTAKATTKAATTTAPPPAPATTTAKPSGPGTVTLQCFAGGGGVSRVILKWTNPGFNSSVTVNGHTYPLLNTASTGLGSSAPETTPGHGSCSGTVGGVSKSGSY